MVFFTRGFLSDSQWSFDLWIMCDPKASFSFELQIFVCDISIGLRPEKRISNSRVSRSMNEEVVHPKNIASDIKRAINFHFLFSSHSQVARRIRKVPKRIDAFHCTFTSTSAFSLLPTLWKISRKNLMAFLHHSLQPTPISFNPEPLTRKEKQSN